MKYSFSSVKLGLLILLASLIGCSNASSPNTGLLEHHTETGFRNSPEVEPASSKGALFVLRRIWGSAFHPDIPAGHILPEEEAVKNLAELDHGNVLTWLGHSTFLIRLDGKTIMTDPFLTNRASPISFVGGITRYAPPGITIQNLPPIDIIIVSHNHYDHLDRHTICALPNKENIHVAVPLGLQEIFINCGYEKVKELDWGSSANVGDIKLTALPAAHDSGRSLFDKDKTLWSSWAISADSTNFFFSGDTGYSPVFKEIGKEYGPFDLAILPIGAYEPRELMWMSHITPEEAVKVGQDIKANILVGGHWGTIELSEEPQWEPPARFVNAANAAGKNQESVWVMKIGESRAIP